MRLPLAILALSLPAGAASAGPVTGQWLTASGNVIVRVAPCGPALCGAVAKVLGNGSMAHPGQAMAGAPPAMGLKILSDLRADGPGQWTGHIYNREDGKTYDCQVSVDAQDRLAVRAYVGLPLFGKTQLWRRQPGG
jgi:uncharacterized protein (DUF2147 family)